MKNKIKLLIILVITGLFYISCDKQKNIIKYDWKDDYSECSAQIISQDDDAIIVYETVKTNVLIVEATCDKVGSKTYLAEFKNELFEKKIKSVIIPALGHDYDVTYVWNEDYSSCSATAICSNNTSHKIKETVNSVNDEDLYTAVFKNNIFDTQIYQNTSNDGNFQYYEFCYIDDSFGLVNLIYENNKLEFEAYYIYFNPMIITYDYVYENDKLKEIVVTNSNYEYEVETLFFIEYDEDVAISSEYYDRNSNANYNDIFCVIDFYDNGMIRNKEFYFDNDLLIHTEYDISGRRVYDLQFNSYPMLIDLNYDGTSDMILDYDDSISIIKNDYKDGFLIESIGEIYDIDTNITYQYTEGKISKCIIELYELIDLESEIIFKMEVYYDDLKLVKYKEWYYLDNEIDIIEEVIIKSKDYYLIKDLLYIRYDKNNNVILKMSEESYHDEFGIKIGSKEILFDNTSDKILNKYERKYENGIMVYYLEDEYVDNILDNRIITSYKNEDDEYHNFIEFYKYDLLGNITLNTYNEKVFDEEGRIIFLKEIINDITNNEYSHVEHNYKYDENNNKTYYLIEKFNEQGILIESIEEYILNDKLIIKKVFYDNQGNQISEEIIENII